MAGVTLRTIRYYDKIGLLKPSHILDNGYRQYCNKDLITLQKILALKELGFSLEEIYPLIIDNDKDSFKESLKLQTSLISQKMNHLNNLKATIKSTEKMKALFNNISIVKTYLHVFIFMIIFLLIRKVGLNGSIIK